MGPLILFWYYLTLFDTILRWSGVPVCDPIYGAISVGGPEIQACTAYRPTVFRHRPCLFLG